MIYTKFTFKLSVLEGFYFRVQSMQSSFNLNFFGRLFKQVDEFEPREASPLPDFLFSSVHCI